MLTKKEKMNHRRILRMDHPRMKDLEYWCSLQMGHDPSGTDKDLMIRDFHLRQDTHPFSPPYSFGGYYVCVYCGVGLNHTALCLQGGITKGCPSCGATPE